MEAISGRKTLQEIAADHAILPIRMSQWKKQLLEGAGDLYPSGEAFGYSKSRKGKRKEIYRKERLSSFRKSASSEWGWNGLKRVSAARLPMNCADWSV